MIKFEKEGNDMEHKFEEARGRPFLGSRRGLEGPGGLRYDSPKKGRVLRSGSLKVAFLLRLSNRSHVMGVSYGDGPFTAWHAGSGV